MRTLMMTQFKHSTSFPVMRGRPEKRERRMTAGWDVREVSEKVEGRKEEEENDGAHYYHMLMGSVRYGHTG